MLSNTKTEEALIPVDVMRNFSVAVNKLYYIIIMIISCEVCSGQNLVPNGDFEQYSGCPSWSGQIDSALFWINPSANSGMADYYNQCSLPNAVGVPNNWMGYQQARSGVAYAGLLGWIFNSNYREYIETTLTSTLVANVCYNLKMYINQGNNYIYNNSYDIGVYFSDTLISGINNYHVLPFLPQINNSVGNFPDTLNWTLVCGDYTAHGGENYLIIGNFKSDSNTTVIDSPLVAVYFLIDDVSLTPCGAPCSAVGIQEQNGNAEIKIYPNPITDKINITVKTNETIEVSLYDVTARRIFKQSFVNSTTINTEQLAKGIYLYELKNKSGVINKGKVVRE